VHVDTGAGWFLADAWGRHPVFFVHGRPGRPLAGVPEYAELDAHGELREHGHYPRRVYEDGVPREPRVALLEPAGSAEAVAQVRAMPAGAPERPSAWQAYLGVRLAHAAASRMTAGAGASGYRELLSAYRFGGLTREVVEAFAARSPAKR
jgi:hypothetical protein